MSAAATPADVLAGNARWCVVEGERDEVLASIADGAVDVTITDPPYNERTHRRGGVKSLVGGKVRRVTLGFAEADGFGFTKQMLAATRRWCVAFCALEDLGEYQREAGESWVRAGVWPRVDGAPRFTGDRPAQGAEGVAIMHRRGTRTTWNGGGSRAHWACGVERINRAHPTQKPLRLMRELVRLFSDPGEVIADWHAGSGTTGEAALLEGRRVILVERDPVHAATARARMEATEPGEGTRRAVQQRLFAAVGS